MINSEIPEAQESNPPQKELEELKKELETLDKPEEKLSKSIELMEAALAQSGNPNFKTFWDTRNICLELFKTEVPSAIKAFHWEKYRELTIEARRLKEMFEEQSAFAVEQINMAIQGIENDVQEFSSLLKTVNLPQFPKFTKFNQKNLNFYRDSQRQLMLLNAQAARVNGLRKELIKTEMRVRQKNLFFQRLSATGEHIFPKRKELIKEMSHQFLEDVETFISTNFSEPLHEKPIFQLREEIKSLQALAKILTLNTHAFTRSRHLLSESWDKLKEVDKERKKTQLQQKQVHKENADKVIEKINEASKAFQESALSLEDAQKQFDEIFKFMRTVELGREEVRTLKEQLAQAQKPLKDQLKEDERKRKEKELEKEEQRQKKIQTIEEQVKFLEKQMDDIESEELSKKIQEIRTDIEPLNLTSHERDAILCRLTPVEDCIANREEKALLQNLPKEHSDAIKELQGFLDQRQQRRASIKEEMEKYRRAAGGSGLDFEQSLHFNERLNAEKERLEVEDQGIEEIERKISDLRKG